MHDQSPKTKFNCCVKRPQTAPVIQMSRQGKGRHYVAERLHKSHENRIMSLVSLYRWGGGSAQLLLQPRLLGLLQLRAGRGVIEKLGVQNQAEDSTHLRQQKKEETMSDVSYLHLTHFSNNNHNLYSYNKGLLLCHLYISISRVFFFL